MLIGLLTQALNCKYRTYIDFYSFPFKTNTMFQSTIKRIKFEQEEDPKFHCPFFFMFPTTKYQITRHNCFSSKMYLFQFTILGRDRDLDEGPPEKATRTLSVGQIMALEMTASLNFPYKLLRKQSAQKRPSSALPPEMGSLDLHLMQTFRFRSL